MPIGMIGAIFYICHCFLGQLLWKEYNPITTDISSLTAMGAPNRILLLIFTTIYGIATIIFIIGMIFYSFRKYKFIVRAGWIIFLVMNIVSIFGYSLFPLTGDKTHFSYWLHKARKNEIIISMFGKNHYSIYKCNLSIEPA